MALAVVVITTPTSGGAGTVLRMTLISDDAGGGDAETEDGGDAETGDGGRFGGGAEGGTTVRRSAQACPPQLMSTTLVMSVEPE